MRPIQAQQGDKAPNENWIKENCLIIKEEIVPKTTRRPSRYWGPQ